MMPAVSTVFLGSTVLLGSIPSPSTSRLGPFSAYGLMIALGVMAAYELARRRWERIGGDPEDMGSVAVWAVPAGLVGARLYHVATDWNRLYADSPGDVFKVWEGGLGIPGGILLGTLVGMIVARRRGMRLSTGLDAVAPGLPIAQAIGRLGNWWNQELYGRPTELPWGLEIDCIHRVSQHPCVAGDPTAADILFHPTFLYEALWNLALAGLLIVIGRRQILRPGRLFAVYIAGYAMGRFWVESVRIDTATELLGIRVNLWTSGVVLAGVLVMLVIGGLRRRESDYYGAHAAGHDPEPPAPRSKSATAKRRGAQYAQATTTPGTPKSTSRRKTSATAEKSSNKKSPNKSSAEKASTDKASPLRQSRSSDRGKPSDEPVDETTGDQPTSSDPS